MANSINQILTNVDDFVWGVPLMVLILAGGILLTLRLGILQIRKLPLALKYMVSNDEGGNGEISSFAALCTALSATIGTGNIVGVATAVCAGGPGALFWMIVTAFFGMATKYSEGLLAIKYRVINKDGHSLGGPFYYIERGMGKNWKLLAKIFSFFGVCVGLFGIGTFSQVNGISRAINGFFDADNSHCVNIPFFGEYSWSVVIASLVLTVCVALVLIGGVKRIANVSQIVVPFMAILYVLFVTILVITNITQVPAAIKIIVTSAFVLMLCLVFFTFTTILGWDYYSERCLEYLSDGNVKHIKIFRWLYILAVFIGPYMTVSAVWTIADIFNGLMAIPNMIVIFALNGVVVAETRKFFKAKAVGRENESDRVYITPNKKRSFHPEHAK